MPSVPEGTDDCLPQYNRPIAWPLELGQGDLTFRKNSHDVSWITVWKCRLLWEPWWVPASEVPKWHKGVLEIPSDPGGVQRTSPSKVRASGFDTTRSIGKSDTTWGDNPLARLPPQPYLTVLTRESDPIYCAVPSSQWARGGCSCARQRATPEPHS